jgi:hypothetical protein
VWKRKPNFRDGKRNTVACSSAEARLADLALKRPGETTPCEAKSRPFA